MQLKISIRNLQKVEFNEDPNKCKLGFTAYKVAGGRPLLITDVPSNAGSMLGAFSQWALSPLQEVANTPSTFPVPVVLVDCTDPVDSGSGFDVAKYAGRLEIREYVG